MGSSEWIMAENPMRPDEYAAFVELVGPIVEAQNGRLTMGEILNDFAEGRCAIWYLVHDGRIRSLCVGRVREYVSGLRVYRVAFGGGHMMDFFLHIGQAEHVARAAGCSRIQVSGRPGWKKSLEKFGDHTWKEVSRTIEKEI